MQKIVTALIGTFAIATSTLAAQPDSVNSARVKYPYSLIGEDFGILNEADLAANTCDVYPQPFSFSSDSLYWRCFESREVKFSCDSSGAADPNEGVMGLIVLSANAKDGHHEYLARRPWQIADCSEFGRTFAAAIKGTQHLCITGSSPRKSSDPRDTQATTWIFEKYKTPKTCGSYFEGHCDLAYQFKHGCKVIQTKPTPKRACSSNFLTKYFGKPVAESEANFSPSFSTGSPSISTDYQAESKAGWARSLSLITESDVPPPTRTFFLLNSEMKLPRKL